MVAHFHAWRDDWQARERLTADILQMITQVGRGNRLGVFQFGKGTAVDVTQTGRQGATLVFLGGW